jgi:cation:H+ antiporter
MIIWDAIFHEEVLYELMAKAPTYMLFVFAAISIIALSKGADWMIDGVVALAKRTGMPKIIIGATIVSLGTTMPETFVSVMAAFSGDASLALGNGVGSIIADTGLIFGLSIMVSKVPINRYIMQRSGWWQIGAATLLVLVSGIVYLKAPTAPILGKSTGLLFLALLCVYMYTSYRWAKAADSDFSADEENMSIIKTAVLIIVGIFLVILGAKILIPSVSIIAERFGVPKDVIAATMVAFGTSLPELITALTAIKKGHPEIIIGNVIGADVLNCLFVIGASAFTAPLQVAPNFYLLHFPVMLLILYSLRIYFARNKDRQYFGKSLGIWMFAIYIVYLLIQYVVL